MIKAALAFCSVLFCMSCAFAQQPSFPFLQDGGARDSFVKSMNDSCLNAAAEHNDHSQKVQKYCICYAGAVADIINGQEYEAFVLGYRLELGLDTKELGLLMLTLLLSVITLGTGRTTVLQGVVHLVIFAAFLFFAVVP